MLRVYLDQNKWIDLARAAHRSGNGGRFEDALAVARAMRGGGDASFVLTAQHYQELYNRVDFDSRCRLGVVMSELSRFHAIAPLGVIVPWEVDIAFNAFFGRPQDVPSVQVFGVGASHAFGRPAGNFTLDNLPPLPPGVRSQLQAAGKQWVEVAFLIGSKTDRNVRLAEMVRGKQYGHEYAWSEEAWRAAYLDSGDGSMELLERFLTVTEFRDISKDVAKAQMRAGVSSDESLALAPSRLAEFIRHMPSRDVTLALRMSRHRNPQKAWSPNDLNDIVSLAVAVPYCDVVVTEKSWVHAIKTAKLDVKYKTIVISDTAGLSSALVSATRNQ